MLGHQFAHSTAPIRKVKEVQFGILSPEEIKAYSVAKVEHPEVMDETTHKPKMGGLMDPRMGTIDRNFKCQTCGEGMSECPGHFGHIELARPVFHPGFIIKVKKILECICVNCGKLKADISDPNFADKIRHIRDPKARMAVVWAHCKTKMVCETDEPKEDGAEGDADEPKKGHGGCGHVQPAIRKEGLKLFVQYKRPKDEDEDVKSMQPDKRLITPSEVYTTFKKMSDSDLHLIGLSDEYARPEWMILTVMPVPPPPVRPSIAVDGGAMRSEDDLTYKLGEIIKASAHVRRCEQEGAPAHVISEHEHLLQFHVATYMDNDIAGIPQALQKSGRPVKAIRARLKGKEGRLRGNLMGKRVDFSARTVITGDPNLELDEVGVPRSIAMNLTYPERVTPYNIAYLQELVRNGPTTYPGARYVVRDTGERIDLRYNKRADAFLQYGWIVERHLKDGDVAFRLNLSVTPPYNADFDGDEMNMHIPQSEETRAELSQIAWVPRQIISPQANKPVMGIVQDTLYTFLDWNQVQNILLWVPGWDGNPKPMCMVIPRDPKSSNPIFDDGMLIENGEIIFGVVEKKTVGASQGGLKGPEATRDLFTGIQMVVNFCIGIGDTVAGPKVMGFITQRISEKKQLVAEIIDEAYHDRLKALPGMTIRESFESKVERELNRARDDSGQYAQKNLKDDNNVKQMVTAGSKGSYINISQIVEGRRIPFGFRHRTLPHFTKDDFSPEARLTPQEEGLIDTAVKTAETGYIQRRLVKALEDVMVHYDGTFVYGEDGMDGAFIEPFEHNYRNGFLPNTLQIGLQMKLDEEYNELLNDRRLLRQFIFPQADGLNPHYLPVNLHRIIQNATQIFHIDKRKPSDLEPAYIVEAVQQLNNRLAVVVEVQANSSLTFRMHVRATMATRRVLEQFHLTREAFDWVLGEVEAKFNQSLVNPGEMCGTLAAQSIGEPATQMTLNTFHYAGVSSKNVTLGVPRLKEIINVATKIKTPSLTVYLEPDIAEESLLAKNVEQELAYTSLRTVTAAVEIWYDPDPSSTIIEEDSVFVESFFAIPDEEIESKLHLQSPWLLRLELDRAKMIDRKLTMAYVAGRIAESFKTDLFVIWSEDNSEKLIIRCRVLGGGDKDEDGLGSVEEDIFLRQLENTMLNSVSLRGVPGIQKVFLQQHDKVYIDKTGAIKTKKEWVLETDGINLKTVMCIDSVDFTRTYSNSCVEIFNVLGIEAARAAIMRELRGVIEFDGSYVNYRHLALLCDLMTHRGSLMAITRHGINRADTGALMRCSFEETVEILMEAAAVGEKDDCHGIAENVMFGQLAPMGTGAFDVALDIDMLKDAIVDHRLPVQNMLAAQADGGMTPGQVAMTPYDTNSPAWSEGNFKGESAAFSPLAVNGGEDPANFSFLGYGQSPLGAGGMSPAGPGYSPSSPNTYSPTSPYVPQSPFGGATSPFGTSPYATSPFYDRGRGPTSPTYSPTSPALNLTSPGYSPTSPRYSPTSPSFSPTSPRYSPQSPSFSPTSPRYSPTSPSFSPASPRSPAQMSPSSPKYSPTSPVSPSSPKYSPASPAYSPTSPQWSPSSPAQNGRSHSYSTSPSWE
ncbi:DNA-directed RNA polymerase II, subunit 1 [Suillus brevipes Sb2]|nr:DNA-directed RNA polymerase II, subunit 1 [Suillus brevipes Sb2]